MRFTKRITVEVLDGQKIMEVIKKKGGGMAKAARDLNRTQSHLTNVLKSPRYKADNPFSRELIAYCDRMK